MEDWAEDGVVDLGDRGVAGAGDGLASGHVHVFVLLQGGFGYYCCQVVLHLEVDEKFPISFKTDSIVHRNLIKNGTEMRHNFRDGNTILEWLNNFSHPPFQQINLMEGNPKRQENFSREAHTRTYNNIIGFGVEIG